MPTRTYANRRLDPWLRARAYQSAQTHSNSANSQRCEASSNSDSHTSDYPQYGERDWKSAWALHMISDVVLRWYGHYSHRSDSQFETPYLCNGCLQLTCRICRFDLLSSLKPCHWSCVPALHSDQNLRSRPRVRSSPNPNRGSCKSPSPRRFCHHPTHSTPELFKLF